MCVAGTMHRVRQACAEAVDCREPLPPLYRRRRPSCSSPPWTSKTRPHTMRWCSLRTSPTVLPRVCSATPASRGGRAIKTLHGHCGVDLLRTGDHGFTLLQSHRGTVVQKHCCCGPWATLVVCEARGAGHFRVRARSAAAPKASRCNDVQMTNPMPSVSRCKAPRLQSPSSFNSLTPSPPF